MKKEEKNNWKWRGATNMREIKFRAWSRTNNKIHNWEEILSNPNVNYLSMLASDLGMWEFLQFTGLKDKNGKEIYEGDIVARDEEVIADNREPEGNYVDLKTDYQFKYWDESIGVRHYGRPLEVVRWKDSSCGFEPFSDSDRNCGHCDGGIKPEYIEVVGNIYENPEII